MEAAAALCSLSSPPALTHLRFSNSSSSKPYYPTIPSLIRPLYSSISASTPSSAATSPPSSKKVLIPIGFGTEEIEAVVMIEVLRRSGAEVTVASVEPQLQVEASGGIRIVADTCISKCRNEVLTSLLCRAIKSLCEIYWVVVGQCASVFSCNLEDQRANEKNRSRFSESMQYRPRLLV